ncbi:MAG: amino acid-binding protein [Proteobacteria bacterium]|nr:amino acid-binding protein [Pseudomonadota bacterium]MBU1738715.1 amino acid-binding protein [Pseudomonadota bacterium]
MMQVDEITAVLENVQGRVADVAALLAENGINILACSLADHGTSDRRNLQMIVNDTESAVVILAKNGIEVSCSQVIVAETPDKPGGLAQILLTVKKTGLYIQRLYAFSQRRGDKAIVVLGFADIDQASKLLSRAGIRLLSNEKLLAM